MARLKVNVDGIRDDLAIRLIRISAKAAFYHFEYPFDAMVDVTVTDDAGIREYNREYREIDKATDVLSFPMGDFYQSVPQTPPGMMMDPGTGMLPLGDMIISAERARAQAKEYGHSFARECAYLTVHSMLHLLGYDHLDEGVEKAAMRAAEEAILAKLGLSRKEEGEEQ
jgi:probable rRNA maturation factor